MTPPPTDPPSSTDPTRFTDPTPPVAPTRTAAPERVATPTAARRLILLRHGKSDYPGGVSDYDRPLAPRGRREAALAGRWLADTQPAIDLVLCSGAERARQTLDRAGVDAPVRYVRELYGATADEVLAVIRRTEDTVRTLLVVGHAPGLPDASLVLAGPASHREALDTLSSGFPTSTMTVLDLSVPWSQVDDSVDGALVAMHAARE